MFLCVFLLASHNSSLSCWPGRTLLGTSLVSLFSSSASGFFEFFIVLRFPLVCVDGSFSSSIDPDLASRRASLRGTRTPRSHYWSPFRSFRLQPVEEDLLFIMLCLLGVVTCGCESVVDGRGGRTRLSRSPFLFVWPGCPSSAARASSARLRSGGVLHLRGILIGAASAAPRLGAFGLHFAWDGIVPSALARSG